MKSANTIKRQFYKSAKAVTDKPSNTMKAMLRGLVIDDGRFMTNREEVKYWKSRIYYITAAIILIFGAPLMLFGAYMFYSSGQKIYASFEAILYLFTVLIIINKKLSITSKKYYIAYALYLVSIFLLVTTGTIGGGLVCVVFALILSGCILERNQILTYVSINLIAFAIITVFLYTGLFDGTSMENYKMVWMINAATAQGCGIMLLILMNKIYTGLERQAQLIKKSESSLAASEEKHKAMIANISDAIVIIDVNGYVKYTSPNLMKRFPWMSKDIMNRSFYEKFYQDDRNIVADTIHGLLERNGKIRTIEARYLTSKREIGYLQLTAVNLTEDPNINGILINYNDITSRKVREEEILYLNQHDSLTGLYNRSYFEAEKERLDTKGQLPLSIIVGDINGLKIINDSLGHAEGDRLLVTMARIIKKCARKGDIVARISGDEFNILLPKTKMEEALNIIKKINDECDEYNAHVIGDLYHISISLGSSTKTVMKESLDIVQKVAEDFMYKRKLLEGRSFHSSIISSMKIALFEKSYETEQHAQRLIHLTKGVGKAIGLSNLQFDELELFSTLHDIGKIGIDNQVLNKPSSLSEEEWVKMRKHSEIGYRIAMASPELMSIAYYILTHHERFDGTGYPQGLAGENIPLLSRILAVADAYDAMTEDRPYRKGMSKQEAIAEIERNVGTQFDPRLAKIFVEIISETHEKLSN